MNPAPWSSDFRLAARLEAAEAANLASMAASLAAAQPETGATAQPIAGGIAVFAGAGSPMTHATGTGMAGTVSSDELDRLEDFFQQRGSPVLIDLCPLADTSLISLIQSRQYHIAEFNDVLVRPVGPEEIFAPPMGWDIRAAAPAEMGEWSRLVMRGFEEREDVDPGMADLLAATCAAGLCLVASNEGEPSGGGAMGTAGGVALFYGDSTLARFRRRGLQSALIQERLARAREAGCDLAVASVLPGSTSHRNYERAGFRLAYMRVSIIRKT